MMAYYAPFYRPTYYDQMQTNPNINQFNQQQFQQPMQQIQQPAPQPMSGIQNPNNDIIWVQGEAGAKAYLVAPNNTVTLWDSENQTIYIKSADGAGVPSMRVLDWTERTYNPVKPSQTHECACGSKFAPIDEFNALKERMEALVKRIDAITNKNVDATEETENA